MHRRILALLTVPGLALVVSLLTDEQLATIARKLGVDLDDDALAELFFPTETEEVHP